MPKTFISLVSRRSLAGLFVAALAVLSTGCATTQRTTTQQTAQAPALSIGDVAKMVTDKRPDAEIIQDINSRGLRAPANASDLDLLVKQGTSKEVIDAILLAQTPQPNQTTSTTTYSYAYPYVPFGFGFYNYSWGWRGGYSSHYHGGSRYHGGAHFFRNAPLFRRR
jgi:hypothetical protein